MMMFLLCLVFTIASFIWPKTLYLPIICFIYWNVLGLLLGDGLTFVGFGSVNIITQTYALGDPFLPAYTIWLFHGLGMIMLVYGVGMLWGDAYDTTQRLFKGQQPNTIRGYD